MAANVGSFDRATRMTVGIMMSALGLSGTVTGVTGLLLITIGMAALVSGTVGRCLIYRALGWNTVRAEALNPSGAH